MTEETRNAIIIGIVAGLVCYWGAVCLAFLTDWKIAVAFILYSASNGVAGQLKRMLKK